MRADRRPAITAAVLLLFLISAGWPQRADGAVLLDPSLKFRTLETDHFLIHFHQGEEEVARRVARIAEEVHGGLSASLGWVPRSRTQVLLLDTSDEANGAATPFPYNAVLILIAQPGPEESIGFYDDWIRTVFIHEYTHILHLDQARGFARDLQFVFGRLYFPNLFQPLWLIEGLAAYEESALTGAGRGYGSLFDMMIRTAWLEGRLNPIDQGDGPLATWPGGEFPYLYGVMFYKFLVEKYGEDGVSRLLQTSSASPNPFFLNSSPDRALGKNYRSLWDEWTRSLRTTYDAQVAAIRAKGLTGARRVTSGGYQTRGPVFSPDGMRLVYTEVGPAEYPSVRAIARDGTGDEKLVDRNGGMYSSWSRDGRTIVFSQPETYRSFSLFEDLFALERVDGRWKIVRLSRGMRLQYPDISPDGSAIACVRQGGGRTELGIFSPETKSFNPLLSGDDDSRYSSPRWSPDGTRIAFAAFRAGGYREIGVVDARSGTVFTVAGSRHWNIFPAWSPDGAALVYSSDRTGVSNLYAYSFTDGATRQITNLSAGAFESAVSPDGREIAFTGYSSAGFDLYLMDFSPETGWPVDASIDPPPAGAADPGPGTDPAHPYSPWRTLWPRFWFPLIDYSTQDGFSAMALTAGADVLLRHTYLVEALYRAKVHRAGGYAAYENDVLRPSILLQGQVIPSPAYTYQTPSGQELTQWETDAGGDLDISYPIIFFRSSHRISFGYGYHAISAVTPLPSYLVNPPEEGRFAGLRAGYAYSNALRFPLSISPEDGRSVSLTLEALSRGLGGDFDMQRVLGDYREYVSLPFAAPRHVLALRIAGGTAWGQVLNRRAFLLGGYDRQETPPGVGDQGLSLRGYPAGALRGQKAALASAEYRLPLGIIQRGCWTWPVFFDNISVSAFFDIGDAWDGYAVSLRDLRKGTGAELKMDTTIVYALPVTLTLGYARGLDAGGIDEVYVTLGGAF